MVMIQNYGSGMRTRKCYEMGTYELHNVEDEIGEKKARVRRKEMNEEQDEGNTDQPKP
jgi:hypothetical protein